MRPQPTSLDHVTMRPQPTSLDQVTLNASTRRGGGRGRSRSRSRSSGSGSSGSKSAGGGGACFAGAATVLLSNGSTKPMTELSIGDSVLTSEGYQPVETFFHRDPNVQGDFVRINDSITLSAGHFVAVGSDNNFIRASEVKVGEHVVIVNGVAMPVASVETVAAKGIYAPVTECGTIVVDGVLASCYSNVESHEMAHFVVRTWVMFGNDLSKVNDTTGAMNPHIAKLATAICT